MLYRAALIAGRERGSTEAHALGSFPRQLLKFKIGIEF